jgi:hypothetical protein
VESIEGLLNARPVNPLNIDWQVVREKVLLNPPQLGALTYRLSRPNFAGPMLRNFRPKDYRSRTHDQQTIVAARTPRTFPNLLRLILKLPRH